MKTTAFSAWQPIETAPMDGSKVWVKRVHEGRIVKEGWAVFGVCSPTAPQRRPLAPDPLDRVPNYDFKADAEATQHYADKPKWLLLDRMYSFPAPTHWKPSVDERTADK